MYTASAGFSETPKTASYGCHSNIQRRKKGPRDKDGLCPPHRAVCTPQPPPPSGARDGPLPAFIPKRPQACKAHGKVSSWAAFILGPSLYKTPPGRPRHCLQMRVEKAAGRRTPVAASLLPPPPLASSKLDLNSL